VSGWFAHVTRIEGPNQLPEFGRCSSEVCLQNVKQLPGGLLVNEGFYLLTEVVKPLDVNKRRGAARRCLRCCMRPLAFRGNEGE